MRKLAVTFALLAVSLVSFSQVSFIQSGSITDATYKYKNGDDTPVKVAFQYLTKDVERDSITRLEIETFIKHSVVSAKYAAKNRYSFKFSSTKRNTIMVSGNNLLLSISGSAENGYGNRAAVNPMFKREIGNLGIDALKRF